MANAQSTEQWQDLVIEFTDEPGVTLTEDGLAVGGTLFAFPQDDDLILDVSAERAADLVRRGMATHFTRDGARSRDWVRVADRSLWSELTREAHEYVGEPPVGGQS